jgi:succinate-acetate transporter protein
MAVPMELISPTFNHTRSLTLLFFLLAIGDYTAASPAFKHFTGYEGIICGASAIYTGLAQVLNELFAKTIWPLGVMKK